MSLSRWLAAGTFIVSVPGGIAITYVGYLLGYYTYGTIPIAFGIIFLLVIVMVFVVLSAHPE